VGVSRQIRAPSQQSRVPIAGPRPGPTGALRHPDGQKLSPGLVFGLCAAVVNQLPSGICGGGGGCVERWDRRVRGHRTKAWALAVVRSGWARTWGVSAIPSAGHAHTTTSGPSGGTGDSQ